MFDYGKSIQQNGFLDFAIKLKSKLGARWQKYFLSFFGTLSRIPPADRLFARSARWAVGGFLYSLKLEVNTACGLSCEMCYIKKSEIKLPTETICRLLDDIASCHVRLEILGGEPLLRDDLEEIIHYAKYRAKTPFVSLYTNGLKANRSRAEKLKEAGLDAVIVTLVSHRSEVHDAFTGQRGSWEKVVRNIDGLKTAGIKVYTFTAIHRKNYLDYRHIFEFVKKQMGVNPLFYQYIPRIKNDDLLIDSKVWGRIKHWILREKNPVHEKFVREFYMLTGNACSGGNFVLTVKADGSVQPCPFLNDIPLGNIYTENIWSIYKNRFRQTLLREFKYLPPECEECAYKSVCGGGCRAGNRQMFGTYKHRDFRCLGPYCGPIEKDKIVDRAPAFF